MSDEMSEFFLASFLRFFPGNLREIHNTLLLQSLRLFVELEQLSKRVWFFIEKLDFAGLIVLFLQAF